MINILDLIPLTPANAYRYEVLNADGSSKDPPECTYLRAAPGDLANDPTPINRATLMALQGFAAATTVKQSDGTIVSTNADGDTLTTARQSDGSITETFAAASGETITKKTIKNADNSITEVII